MSTIFEPGEYRGRVTRWALTKAKNEKKTPQFALSFAPLGRIDPTNPEGALLPCPDAERTVFKSVTDKTASRVLSDLKATFEYPFDKFTPLDPDNPEGFDFHDHEFTAVLSYELYDGKEREKWNFGASAGYNGEPLSAAEVRRLDTLFGVVKPKRARKQSSPVPVSNDGQPATDQNIPF